jgi:hypothetical protein
MTQMLADICQYEHGEWYAEHGEHNAKQSTPTGHRRQFAVT